MIKEIAAVDGIAGYDASLITLPRFFNDKGEAFVTVENFSYYCYGSYNSQYHELFLSGRFELVEGKHITDDMSNGVIISKELADRNNLKVGDTVTGIYYPENNTPAVDMEIGTLFGKAAENVVVTPQHFTLVAVVDRPVIVRNYSDDEADILVADFNITREELLPSEIAKAYKLRYDAMKCQGHRTDLTSG